MSVECCCVSCHCTQYELDEPAIKSDKVRKLRYFFIMNNEHLVFCVYMQNTDVIVRKKNGNDWICF